MSEFKVTIVDCPAKRLVGMKVRTSMHKASEDCPAVWQAFGPNLAKINAKESYGLSVMLSAEEFYYWSAVDESHLPQLPAGLEQIDIPAGKYARVTVPNLEQLGAAYMFAYETWPRSQSEYTYNELAPCFELYPHLWQFENSFDIYMPLKKA